MTRVKFTRLDAMNGVRVEGHQDGGKKGENIYCAAVSAMVSTLINGLTDEELMVKPEMRVEDGRVLITAMRTPRTDAMFDMLERGFRAFAAKEPGRVEIERAQTNCN